jgi:hypothetical protein
MATIGRDCSKCEAKADGAISANANHFPGTSWGWFVLAHALGHDYPPIAPQHSLHSLKTQLELARVRPFVHPVAQPSARIAQRRPVCFIPQQGPAPAQPVIHGEVVSRAATFAATAREPAGADPFVTLFSSGRPDHKCRFRIRP